MGKKNYVSYHHFQNEPQLQPAEYSMLEGVPEMMWCYSVLI